MANYLYLIWYAPQFGGPRHWALFVTSSQRKEEYGTLYHAITDTSGGGYDFKLVTDIRYALQCRGPRCNRTYEDRALLGIISDDVKEMMSEYAVAATQIVNEHNMPKGDAESICHHWVLHIIRSLEDSRLIETGALSRVVACPR